MRFDIIISRATVAGSSSHSCLDLNLLKYIANSFRHDSLQPDFETMLQDSGYRSLYCAMRSENDLIFEDLSSVFSREGGHWY